MKKVVCFSLVIFAISHLAAGAPSKPAKNAENAIEAAGLLEHMKILASDKFEGRAPGTTGEDLSVQYITEQFKKLGLKPGNPNGSYTQEVPMAGILTRPRAAFTVGDKKMELHAPGDFVAFTQRITPDIAVKDSELVFVGYGIVAPEYGWDDFKGVDLKGKTLVFLINDPALPSPNDPAKLDEKMFKGKAMTYYGRWSYKYEIAAKQGAAAAVIVHETIPAAYPWSVVENSNAKENFVIDAPDKNIKTLAVRSWITLEQAKKLFTAAGKNYEQMKKDALQKNFRPVSLGAKADFSLRNKIREFKSHNVIGKLEGSDPQKKNEYLIYSAHWDHLGRDNGLTGDQIYNGALDNASGVASLLEIAQAFTKLPQRPSRSILFLATTAEEAGLLGAKYYAEHPLYPLDHTLADINIDMINPWGKTRDIEDISYGNSTLDELLAQAAQREGRIAKPNTESEKGTFFRADNFEFAKVGVPALYLGSKPKDFLDQPADYGQKKSDDYTLHHYHQVSDEVNPAWDLSGAVEDIRLLFEVGDQVAEEEKYPTWLPGSEFKTNATR
ncbi:MAG TPA: M20/M25/M40 family metallo-hydrolase [Chthoniobacterales bacterium]|nr:M20/M25/M40 family metallo-hydrolase [Chthoniobacterales bacterium]